MLNILLYLLFLVFAISAFNVDDYCDIPCKSFIGVSKHTVCERANVNCGPHSRCRNFKVVPMTEEDRQAILDKHNALRNKVALGQERHDSQPPAANMNQLNYDVELEYIAQCLANTCQMRHDVCRRTKSLSVGQNLAIRKQSWKSGLENINLTLGMIQSWYNEVGVMDRQQVNYFTGQSGVGHYTEMVWGNIEYVGCARAKYTENSWYTLLLVCNYGGTRTSGNVIGTKIYDVGEPCSKCPENRTCHPTYKGLCSSSDTNFISADPGRSRVGHSESDIKDKVVNESGRVGRENVKLLFSMGVWMLLSKIFV